MSSEREKRRERRRRRRREYDLHRLRHPQDYGYYPYLQGQVGSYYGYPYHSPYSVQPEPIIHPAVPVTCGCKTCTEPFFVSDAIKGQYEMCTGSLNTCRPGDERCYCYDSCQPGRNEGRGWNCSHPRAGGHGVPRSSTCALIGQYSNKKYNIYK